MFKSLFNCTFKRSKETDDIEISTYKKPSIQRRNAISGVSGATLYSNMVPFACNDIQAVPIDSVKDVRVVPRRYEVVITEQPHTDAHRLAVCDIIDSIMDEPRYNTIPSPPIDTPKCGSRKATRVLGAHDSGKISWYDRYH